MTLEETVAALEQRVAALEQIAEAGAAYVFLRRLTGRAERRLVEAHKDYFDEGLQDVVDEVRAQAETTREAADG